MPHLQDGTYGYLNQDLCVIFFVLFLCFGFVSVLNQIQFSWILSCCFRRSCCIHFPRRMLGRNRGGEGDLPAFPEVFCRQNIWILLLLHHCDLKPLRESHHTATPPPATTTPSPLPRPARQLIPRLGAGWSKTSGHILIMFESAIFISAAITR